MLFALPERRRWLPVVAAVTFGLAGCVVLLAPGAATGSGDGTFSWQAQFLAVLAASAVTVFLVDEREQADAAG